MIGDREYKVLPKGFYISLIQKAFEDLAIDTFFDERRADFDFPADTLTLPLPEGCFNIRNIYMYTGTHCDFVHTRKVYWKANYYTEGKGYIANNKGHNLRDPFYRNGFYGNVDNRYAGTNTHDRLFDPNRELFYGLQMGNIMFSSSCKTAGTKVHIHYNGTGCAIGEIPIIPIFLRTAIEDYVMCYALMFRIANDSAPRRWQALLNTYERRLDREGMGGSWHNAELRIKSLNQSQRDELALYLGRPS